MLRKLYLKGELGEKYGRVAEVKAESVRSYAVFKSKLRWGS